MKKDVQLGLQLGARLGLADVPSLILPVSLLGLDHLTASAVFHPLLIFLNLGAGNDEMWNQTILIYQFSNSPQLYLKKVEFLCQPLAKFTSSTPDL